MSDQRDMRPWKKDFKSSKDPLEQWMKGPWYKRLWDKFLSKIDPMEKEPDEDCKACSGTGRQTRDVGNQFQKNTLGGDQIVTDDCRVCDGVGRVDKEWDGSPL